MVEIRNTQSWTSGATESTTHAPTMPSDVVSGDVLLCIFQVGYKSGRTTETLSPSAGWTSIATAYNPSSAAHCVSALFWKIADGSDTLTVTVGAARKGSAVTYVFSSDATNIEAAWTYATSGNANPPAVTLAGESDSFFVMAAAAITNYNANTFTAGPSGFSGYTYYPQSTIGGIATAYIADSSIIPNPGTFTNSNDDWVAWTIVVYKQFVLTTCEDTLATTDQLAITCTSNVTANEVALAVWALAFTGTTIPPFWFDDGVSTTTPLSFAILSTSLAETNIQEWLGGVYGTMLLATLTTADPLTLQTAITLSPTDRASITDACFSIHAVDLPTTISVSDDLNSAVRAVLELAVLLEAQDTQTTSLSIATSLLETLVAQDVAHAITDMSLEDTTALADELSGAIRAQLALPETVRLRDSLETSLVVSIPLLTTATLLDTLGKLVSLAFDETATLTDSPVLGATVKAGGTETLNVSAISELLTVLGVSLDEQATLQAIQQLTQIRDVLLDETTTLTDAQRIGLQVVLAANEQLAVSDTGTLSIALMTRLNETVSLDDLATVSISTWLNLTDGAAFIARLPLEDGDYQAWVMNAETAGTTQYTHYPMNSLFTFQGVPYGVSETGLYRLEGETDDGDPINSVIATGDMNFGTSREKNVPRCYLYLTQTGQVVLKTISSRQGSRHETYYELAERTTDSTDDDTYRRVPLGRGVRGVWWRFELHALDGATINLDGAEIRPVVLSRRG